ncbi:hypothetical protein DFR40_2615 [Azonexus fungiphilus]|uniref:Uncharacterized protein n=1 Tax=Azonexus fungiphilus TaxID=146940 RepID=A0A495VQJ0_9RHOO|nr:hypothetical protein [Azonexus fungiphilus]RKT50693.1 hypothetical protein DFR40_2615 [Azonexus fungiphilus]
MTKALPLLALLLAVSAGVGADDTGLERAVSELGTLNGVALACKQNALAARMREIMVDTVPKERSVGEVFEQATHASFLDFGSAGRTCPDGKSLAGEVDRAREKLRRAAGKPA